MLGELLVDLRYGVRMMLRSPGFTLVALLTMALGIGANTAMFSIFHGVVLKPLPYPESDRIVILRENNLSKGFASFTISPLNFWDWQERNRSMEKLAAFQRTTVNHTGVDRPESLTAYRVSEDYLEIVGGLPNLGRGITKQDLDPKGEAVVVLTDGFWQRAFGGAPDAVGRTMVLDGVVHTVVGVMPQNWKPMSGTDLDVFLPLRPLPFWYKARGSHFLYGLGRLKPGVTVEQAGANFSSIAAALEAEYPDSNKGWGAVVRPLEDALLGSTRPQLLIFMAVVGLVLVVACANLANMTLARATVRTRELAIRAAVGAARNRVVRQLLAESVLLATVAGALGLVLAHVVLGAVVAGWPTLLPRMREVGIDGRVFVFALGLSLVSGVVFGLVPALSVAGPNLLEALRRGSRGVAGDRSRRWMRAGLVISELGLAACLLVGTGLLLRSFNALQAVDPGFRAENRLVLSTPLPRAKYGTPETIRAFTDAALARLGALPGVKSVALTSLVPLEGSDEIWAFWLEGRTVPGGEENGSALFYRVSPSYFDTAGIPLLAGRGITPEDREGSRPVVVISASLAEQHFRGQSPLGQRLRFSRGDTEPWLEIVGVAGSVQHYDLGQTSMPQFYVPFSQRPTREACFVINASIPPLGLVDGVRTAIRAVDPDQPLVGIQGAETMIAESISMPRFRTLLMTGFGVTALLLAVVGLYGVMACTVSQRTKEIGVRMALGATRGSVLRLVLSQGMVFVGIGLALGLGGAWALSRILESMLFGVGSRDPAVFAAVPVTLTAVAAAALLVPARRAARVDPIRTLGEE